MNTGNIHMQFRRLATSLMLLAAAMGCTSAGAASGVTDTEIVVGTSVVMSGPLGVLGTGIRDGAAAYFEHVNSGGGVGGTKDQVCRA
ncbi:hypothetical protein ACFS07_19330 [Undibacterium arcticum]